MPTMRGSTSVAANATNANVLDGADYQFIPFDAIVDVYAAQSATGLELGVKATAESLAASVVPNIVQATGRVQEDSDSIVEEEPIPAGKQLKLEARNTTAGALTLFWMVKIRRIG